MTIHADPGDIAAAHHGAVRAEFLRRLYRPWFAHASCREHPELSFVSKSRR